MPEAEPFALVEKGPGGLRISAANGAALAAGIAVGSAVADARAALPALATRPAEPLRDRRALRTLAGWLGRYGPARGLDGDDGLWVDITGVPHLFGGEEKLCDDLSRHLRNFGLTARLGLADTHGAAHALARLAAPGTRDGRASAAPGETAAALAGLPVAGLRLEPDAIRLLVRLGLKRIGQLYGLPRAALAARFRQARPRRGESSAEAAAAVLLLRLDQALGLASEPRRPLAPPPEAVSRLAFPEPLVTAEGILGALERLGALLTERLAAQGLGARRFRLVLFRSDGTTASAAAGTRDPCREPAHICRLLREKAETLDAGFGIDVATLEADRLEPLAAGQAALASGAEPRDGIGALVDRLTSRLGPQRVLVSHSIPSHIPERADQWRLAIAEGGSPADGSPSPWHSPGKSRSREGRITLPGHLPPRPPLLFSQPEPIAVIAELPEGAPQRFVWRRLARRIVRSEGPERIAPEWWQHIASRGPLPRTRDYYRLEDTTGARYWVFREGLYGDEEEGPACAAGSDTQAGEPPLPRWFVHGLFA